MEREIKENKDQFLAKFTETLHPFRQNENVKKQDLLIIRPMIDEIFDFEKKNRCTIRKKNLQYQVIRIKNIFTQSLGNSSIRCRMIKPLQLNNNYY